MIYDSAADTLRHIRRVGELLAPIIGELAQRAATHDASKLEPPEKPIFDEYTPLLVDLTYGTAEYEAARTKMGPALDHHYRENRHHPEPGGIAAMTLVDLLEMLVDWKAATERHTDGSMGRSLQINRERFGIGDQLAAILENTAREYGWLPPKLCGARGVAPNGDLLTCDQAAGHEDPEHCAGSMDNMCWTDGTVAWVYGFKPEVPEIMPPGVLDEPDPQVRRLTILARSQP